MEKYLIILVIVFIAYYSYTCLKETKVEGFADAQTIDGVDESNSINTLAKIAKDIMDGGSFKVLGNITTEGDFSHIGPSKKNKVSLHTPADGRRALYISPQKLDGTGWEWENGLALDFKEKTFSTNSNNLVVGGGTISAPARLHIHGGELLYLLNKNGVIIGKEWGGTGNLAVQGDLTVQGRNILAELDNLNKNAILNNQKISAKPLNDIGNCFDFGSQGRTSCDGNAGWSTVQIYKR